MKLATVLSGQAFIFRSLKEVLAKANELKSGDVLAGVAASSEGSAQSAAFIRFAQSSGCSL